MFTYPCFSGGSSGFEGFLGETKIGKGIISFNNGSPPPPNPKERE